ncbi:dihydrofolate reductase family protein [Microbulbifer taiwanensis]
MNSLQKLVFSRIPDETQWNNSRVLGPNALSELREIKHGPGRSLMVIGSATVVQALARERMIDEFRFFVFPTFIGAGKPLFTPGSTPGSLKLLRTKSFTTGVARADYQVVRP